MKRSTEMTLIEMNYVNFSFLWKDKRKGVMACICNPDTS